MSDNFGSGQPRVLNTEDRSIDNVVFQYKTPPMSSEWNLINQIGNQKLKDIVDTFIPSGWVNTGSINSLEDVNITEDIASVGDVFTSINYTENTFKIMSNDAGAVAIVNGWPIYIKGYGSLDNNNIIELEAPTSYSYRYDFVYLEVWKKLIGKDDPIYPNGDVTATPYTDNELVYDAIGVETTKRVQIQYRIRSKKLDTISNFSEGFDLASLFPIGGRTSEYEFPSYKYIAKGEDDPGLYISGSGTAQDQTILNTVDGYVYAIPMFMVYRRKQGSFNIGALHSSDITRQNFLDGYRSDRVDGKLLDVIYKEDIVDYRHKILINLSDATDLMTRTFRNLTRGDLVTNLGKGFTDFSGGEATFSGGSYQLKIEQINGTGGNDIPNISAGESSSSSFKKRVYSNGNIVSTYNIIKIPVVASGGSTWSTGTYDVSSYIPSPALASITSVSGLYEPSLGEVTNIVYSTVGGTITVTSGSNIIGTAYTIYLQVSLTYIPGNNGFRDVPKDIIEINKSTTNPTCAVGGHKLLRYNLNGTAVQFDSNGKDVNDVETDSRDYISNASNDFTETVDFGMDLVIHRPINPLSQDTIVVNLTDSKLYGYYILGVKSVYENTGTVESPVWELKDSIDFFRNEISVSPPNPDDKDVEYYFINTNTPPVFTGAKEYKITLVVGSKRDYYKVSTQQTIKDEVNSIKFFDFNKQARGIVDVYETIEIVALRDGSTDYFIADTVDKPIIKIASIAVSSIDDEGTYLTSKPYVYDTDGMIVDTIEVNGISSINSILPVLGSVNYSDQALPTRIRIQDTSSSVTGDYIKVVLLVSSYISANESAYNFYYKYTPYQGLLSPSSEITGEFLSEAKALISSKGSGSEDDSIVGTYKEIGGKAKFTDGIRFVQPISTGDGVPTWSNFLDLDTYTYYIRIKNDTTLFKIEKFASDPTRTGWLVLNQPYREGLVTPSVSGDDYEIIRRDTPNDGVRNTIDCMPTFLYEDYKGSSTEMSLAGVYSSNILTGPLCKDQDPLDAIPGTFTLGSSTNLNNLISRGVSDIVLSSDTNDYNFQSSFKRPSIKYPAMSASGDIYKKVFQPYLFLKIDSDNRAKLYLAVISSGSKNDTEDTELYSYSDKDTIDIFEIINRPLIKI